MSLDKSVPCIAITWKQYATSTQLRFVHENVLQMLMRQRVSKILGDDTALPTIHAEDRVWITEDWMPRASRNPPWSTSGTEGITRRQSVSAAGSNR
jgi:thiamine monophosphate kinase